MKLNRENNLYETDYALWLEQQAIALKTQNMFALDWENLLAEIESLAKRDKRAIRSLLTRIYEQIIKVTYWESEKERNLTIWKREISNFKSELNEILDDNPSLKATYLEEIDNECWQKALSRMASEPFLNKKLQAKQLATWRDIVD